MGKRWVAQRVPDNAVVLLPNVNIIQEIDLSDPSRFLASPDLISYAEKKGWYDPKQGTPFNFREAYDKRRSTGWFDAPVPLRSQAMARPVPGYGAHDSPAAARPPSLCRQAEPQAHAHGCPEYLERSPRRDNVPQDARLLGGSPHNLMSSSDGMICNLDNQEIALFQLRSGLPPEIGCVYWRTTAAGCSGVLTPWYAGITETPDAYHKRYDLKQNVTEAFHLNPPAATYDYDGSQAYWVFTDLMNSVDLDYKNGIEKVRPVWRAFESGEFAVQEAVEKTAGALYASDQQLAARFLTDYCAGRLRPWKRPAK